MTLAERVVDFIQRQDPFGDHFSENDLSAITAALDGQIAKALKSADWSNTSIGNKALILAAIEAMQP